MAIPITQPLHVEFRKYQSVPGLSTVQFDYLIPAGVAFRLTEIGGNGTGLYDTTVGIIWDPAGIPEILLYSHGDAVQKSRKIFTGDGVKVLRVELTNANVIAREIGGYFTGTQT